MQRPIFFFITLATIVFMISCQQASKSERVALYQDLQPMEEPSDQKKEALISSSAADTQQDSGRLMVRTANLKFRVLNVAEATYELERQVKAHGGRVAYTHLQSEERGTSNVQIHPDSTLEIHRFCMSNNVVIRIPDAQLDGLLTSLVPMVDYLNYRTIQAEDKTLDYLRNQMASKRALAAGKAYRKDPLTKGEDQYEAEQHHRKIEALQRQSDNARLANRLIEEQASLCTFTLQLYQREERKMTKFYSPKNPPAYSPPTSDRIVTNLSTGWNVLVEFFLFVVQSWSLIVLAIAFVLGYRYVRIRLRQNGLKKQ